MQTTHNSTYQLCLRRQINYYFGLKRFVQLISTSCYCSYPNHLATILFLDLRSYKTMIIPATKAIILSTISIILTSMPKELSATSYPMLFKESSIAVWLPLTKFPTLDFIKSFAEIEGSELATDTSEQIEEITMIKPITRRTPPPINTATPRLI